jgi:hypothetical protein
MRMASRTGPRLSLNSSASSCSPMRAPGARQAGDDAVAHLGGNLLGTVSVGPDVSPNRPELDLRGPSLECIGVLRAAVDMSIG